MPNEKYIYLDTYVLQKDMRIRLPKQVLTNLDVKKGETLFDVYVDLKTKEIILRISNKNQDGGRDERNESNYTF
ncbi:sucrose-6-phosphate hydrolase [Clostridium tyrobutyricum]|uniref:Sucrose-6-phosphate hydrolase n=1 Tax=Clostridium tyrobutyricum DIVETGP TaxID=1408889 RepID=W6NAB4_CLOTY|nr:hypothetical protein [Clostridium tyrobutyricum]AND85601.1 hypothetical protein CTK_C23530 [Clostridium tyrobutyricum]ANP70127.1 hypothetical protein BA182_10670 [Clostridium tyrobutyricum]MBV4433724.1 AbrB/MazE/SpoVT family DNA-binding domain-containing protein [Clostridium tyrobutyricum]QNB65512.1 sucrose-6-phosphate hydrolase [Clostridium tyrobutyricum]CDL92504.1 hypothetical protein CTDIVETGP_2574 [Clostridium tyrobutyricum DIVETGP]